MLIKYKRKWISFINGFYGTGDGKFYKTLDKAKQRIDMKYSECRKLSKKSSLCDNIILIRK